MTLRGAPCRADDRSVDQAAITYETGRYDECVQRFQAILLPDAPTRPTTQEGRSRARMYLAACQMTLKRSSEADAQFEQLIRENYRYSPDRASFSPPILGRFLDIRERLRDEIEAKVKADQEKEAELRRLQEERERQERERQRAIERMAREQIITQRNSRAVALIPFGVGQFQNRQRPLGWALLGAQATFAAASVVSYFLKENIERQFNASVDEREARRLRDLALQANYISFGAFVVTMLGGIAHAQITFVPEFREIRERPLPAPVPPLAPQFTGGTLLWQGHWLHFGAHPRWGKRGLRPRGFAGTVGLRSPRPRQGGRWGCAPRGPLASPGSPHGVKRSIHSRRIDPPRSQKRPLPTLRAGPAGLDPWCKNRHTRLSLPETICVQTNGRDGA
jgi:hypothetical protein